MAERSKDRALDTPKLESAIEKKAPNTAAKRAVAPESAGKTPSKTTKVISPNEPEAAPQVTPEERWNMIAEAAYYHAEKRGFAGGHPADDWAAAEAEIDAKWTNEPEATPQVTPEERWNMIAEAAYYHAEKRGFAGGHPADDWAAAEAEIDAQLAGRKA